MENQSEKKVSIQLLPEKEFEELSFTRKLTTWVVQIGRVIIIATELIAFAVFVGRIKLDRELTDLTDALENQLVILNNAEDFEGNFRDLQERLKIIKNLRQEQVPMSQTLSLLSSLLPQEVGLTGLTFEPSTNEAYLLAQTNSPKTFANAVNNLKNSPEIAEIALTSGRFQAKDNTYYFSLALKFTETRKQ